MTSSAMDSHEKLGGDGVSSKCTPKFGADGGQICMPMSTHIATECCVARQSKRSVGQQFIRNFRNCKSKSKICGVPNRMIAGNYGQQSQETIPLFYLVQKIILKWEESKCFFTRNIFFLGSRACRHFKSPTYRTCQQRLGLSYRQLLATQDT